MADLVEMQINVKSNADAATSGMEKLGSTVLRQLKQIDQLEKEFKQLDSAMNKNKISGQLYAQEVQKLNFQMDSLTKNLNRSSAAQKAQTQAQMAATKSSNRMGVVTQQAGYQVSDFIVQIQSGTNAFVAFGQQASQLVGVLPLIASPLGLTAGAAVALSAGLGIAIPLVTAIGAAFMRSSKAADKAEEKISGLARTLKNYKQEQRALAQSVTTDQLALIDRIEAIKELQQEYLEVLRNTGGGDRSGKNRAEAEATIKILNDLLLKTTGQQKDLQQLINDEYTKRVKSMERANMLASIENKFGQDHIKYRNEARRQAEIELEAEIKASGVSDHIADRLRDRLKNEYDIIDAKVEQDKLDQAAEGRQEAIVNSLKSGLAIYEQMVSENKKIQDAAEKIKDTHNDEQKSLAQKIALIRIETMFGKESAIYQKASAEHARDQYEQSRISQGIKGNLLKIEMDLYDLLQKEKKELEDINKEEKKRVASVAFRHRMMNLTGSGRGGDPRKQGSAYMQSLEYQTVEEIIEELTGTGKKAAKAMEELNDRIRELEDAADPFREYNRELKDLDKLLKAGKISQQAYNKAVDDLNEGLSDSIRIIGDVEDAFSDWISRGFKDFKSFVSDILNSFKNMLVEMAAIALRNRVLIPITTGFMAGMGSSAAASTMSGMTAGTMGAALAGYGSTIGTGISNFGSAALHTITGGSMGSVAAGSTMASIGAVAPYILAAVAVIGLFTSKIKKLDEGLRVTVTNMDTLVESFEVLQKSRLFGLLKGKKFTEYEEVVDSPIVEAVAGIQDSILKAADTLGIGAEAFDNFSYQFQVSLQGLTEEQKIQKVNEELAKMGDAFASLSGHFSNMNDLLATAQQRYDLETRLLQLQGNSTALLTRERERERAVTHELNQGVLDQIYAIEDAKIAFNALANSIQVSKDSITADFNKLMDHINAKISDAEALASQSQSILSMLQGASGRIGMTREAGLDYLRSLRGASRISDEKALGEALSAIGEPSEDLYSSFTDYQREFADQSNLIRDLEEKAGVQVSNDEKILEQLRLEAEAAEDRYESQIAYLDQQLQDAQDQLNALLGLNDSVLGVQDALNSFADAVQNAMAQAAKAAEAAAEAAAIKEAAENQSVLGKYGTGTQYKGFDKAELKGAQELLDAANIAGVKTEGKTGAQIQQDISNATGLAIGLDTGTRDDQFALGGYHSGGFRLVGERGPEIEATGPSRVFSANQAKRMMQNPDLVEAVKSMKEEITELRNEQRQLGINNNKYTKRTYDLYRQWDTEGLPAERT